jgi:two-component system sensor histidine kinase YesM
MRVNARNTSLQRLSIIILVLGILILTFSVIFARHASTTLVRSIHEAIDRLQQFTKEFASGNLQARASPALVEELSDLTDDVNVMAEQMGNLIEQNRREQENLKKAELRTLQAQVNPHFLYNTLDTIVWAAESGKDEEVVVLTKSLSDFFRSSLSSGADWVTVAQEIRHLNGYLSIQKIRYRDILNYEVDIAPEMEQYIMLKLLLQPLVENALYHGTKNKRALGLIRIEGRSLGDDMLLKVQDNGAGMSEEQLQALQNGVYSDRHTGLGLVNVHKRIKLYCGENYGLQFESKLGEGTTVSILLPKKTTLDHEGGVLK